MEGDGPSSGRPVALGLILASCDALSLDQIVCDLLGIPRRSLMTNRVALEHGLGKDPIAVVGEKVENVKIPDFQFPNLSRTDWNLPGFIKKAIKNALTSKPAIQEDLCKNCHQCAEICPPKALTPEGRSLVFDYRRCIRCFCCLEVCPEGAVSIKQGWAIRFKDKTIGKRH